mmetsp:Transcript_13862/g.39934  ORF Transcript_13862/g.39934 Transcript_13862/m.39934 type:complete len:250 (+) Transcript_13862:399-1148(+)
MRIVKPLSVEVEALARHQLRHRIGIEMALRRQLEEHVASADEQAADERAHQREEETHPRPRTDDREQTDDAQGDGDLLLAAHVLHRLQSFVTHRVSQGLPGRRQHWVGLGLPVLRVSLLVGLVGLVIGLLVGLVRVLIALRHIVLLLAVIAVLLVRVVLRVNLLVLLVVAIIGLYWGLLIDVRLGLGRGGRALVDLRIAVSGHIRGLVECHNALVEGGEGGREHGEPSWGAHVCAGRVAPRAVEFVRVR